MVDLMGFVDEAEARDARTRLKAANVACELVVRDAFGPKGGDEYWIRVPATSAAEAASTLGASGGFTTEELTGTAHLSEDRCPSCGASLDPDEDCPRCAPR
jgi:hypothetical protein